MCKNWIAIIGIFALTSVHAQKISNQKGESAEDVKQREKKEEQKKNEPQPSQKQQEEDAKRKSQMTGDKAEMNNSNGGKTMFRKAAPRLPKNYYWQQLANGLEVVVIENHKVPLATIEMAVKNGAYTEGPEYSGLSHLFEHMFFKANRDYPDQEKYIRRTEELGMIWNGTTNVERVNYYFTFDKDSLGAGLQFMNSAMRYPVYKTEDMQKERPVVDGEFQRAESDPGFQLWLETQKKTWGDLVTRKNPIGDHDVINTATPEKMMIIKDKYYHPNNSVLVICGDVKHEEAFSLANKIFGDWANSGFDPHEKYPVPAFKPIPKTEYFIKESSIAQTPYEMIQWIGPDFSTDSAGTIVADVFAEILRLNSSKWQQSLIDKGLATYADLSYTTNKHAGPLMAFVVPNPQKLQELNKEIFRQVSMTGNEDYFTDEQIQTAKDKIRRNHIRNTEKPSSLSEQLTYHWCSTSLDYFTDYIDACMKVTKKDLVAFAKRYLVNQPFIAGMIINPEMNKQLKPAEYFKN